MGGGKIQTQRRNRMKKIVGLTVVALVLVGVMLSDQAMAQKVTPITKANVATLKGTWEGRVDFAQPGMTATCILKIDNDTPPLQGTVEFQNLPDPGQQFQFPGNFENSKTYAGKYENGMITNKGNLIITGQGGNFGEFSLVGKNLQGWFYLWGTRGTISLKKK
jgi:hypothetical protein